MTEIKRVGYYGWDTWVSAKAIQQTMQDFRIDYRHKTGMRLCHVILKEKR